MAPFTRIHKTLHFRIALLLVASLIFTSCNCDAPMRIRPIQTGDKDLKCKDVILEINEAEFYKREAQAAKGVSAGEALMPTCWIGGYMDSNKAEKAAQERIDYLSHVYDLLECGGPIGGGKGAISDKKAELPAAPVPAVLPPAALAGSGMPTTAATMPAVTSVPMAPVMVAPPAGVQQFAPPAAAMAAPQATVPATVTPAPVASAVAGNPVGAASSQQDPYLHVHVGADGQRFMHSHPNNGPHTHIPGRVGLPYIPMPTGSVTPVAPNAGQ